MSHMKEARQKKIIKNYYENRDQIMVQKLSEIVTELYLAESEKKKTQLWARAEKAMLNLKMKGSEIGKIMEERSLEALAKVVSRTF
jgi:hypothetical protein